jgi:predicted nucleic acid-binding protein
VILADTSVWVDHLRAGDKALAALLDVGMVLAHPFVIGELAMGNLRQREIVLKALADLPHASVATDAEVLHFIERHALSGRGSGYIDAHLLAAVKLTAGAELWTNDKRLHGLAVQLELARASPRSHIS